MAGPEKKAFEPHADANTVAFWSADQDKEIRIEAGDVYETAHAGELQTLEAHPKIKTAEKKAGK